MKTSFVKPEALIPFTKIVNDANDLIRLVDQLEGLKRLLFKSHESTPISTRAKEYLSENVTKIFADLELLGLEPQGDTDKLKFIDEIIVYLRNLPKIKVVVAFDPSITFVSKINESLTDQVGKKVILDILVDQHIVAGAAFEYNGKYKEYTMAREVESLISGHIKNVVEPKRNLVN